MPGLCRLTRSARGVVADISGAAWSLQVLVGGKEVAQLLPLSNERTDELGFLGPLLLGGVRLGEHVLFKDM